MKESVRIEHLVMGSLVNEQGDTTLSYTPGVTSDAEALCRMMTGDGPDHASFYLLHPAGMGQHVIVHVQGAHTSFGGGVRDYTTRVVYEFDTAALTAAGGYLPLLGSFDAMRHYEEKAYEAAAEKVVETIPPQKLSDAERRLLGYLAYSLTHHRRLFVRIGEEEKRVADDLRQSPRLRSLLRVFDHLPTPWRDWVSLGFSVECTSADLQALLPDIHVVVHHDPVEAWGDLAGDACVIDWTSLQPEVVSLGDEGELSQEDEIHRLKEVRPTVVDDHDKEKDAQQAPMKRKGCVVNILITVLSIVLGCMFGHIL